MLGISWIQAFTIIVLSMSGIWNVLLGSKTFQIILVFNKT